MDIVPAAHYGKPEELDVMLSALQSSQNKHQAFNKFKQTADLSHIPENQQVAYMERLYQTLVLKLPPEGHAQYLRAVAMDSLERMMHVAETQMRTGNADPYFQIMKHIHTFTEPKGKNVNLNQFNVQGDGATDFLKKVLEERLTPLVGDQQIEHAKTQIPLEYYDEPQSTHP